MRWLGVLLIGTALTAAMATGLLPTGATGFGRALFYVYAPLLLVALVAGIFKRE